MINDATGEDGSASWCLKNKTYVTPAACYSTANNQCVNGGVTLLPSQTGAWNSQSWTVTPYGPFPPTFPPVEFPVGGPTDLQYSFGASNEPQCAFHPTIVTTTADTYVLAASGSTVVSAPGVLENDIMPFDCMPLGESHTLYGVVVVSDC